MFSAAALALADRLVNALMALAEGVGAFLASPAARRSDPTDAYDLLGRVTDLVTRIVTVGNRLAPRRAVAPEADDPESDEPPTDEPAAPPPEPTPRPKPDIAPRQRRRPGWILDALPDTAPAIAAELRHLLADPALAEFLAADPALTRRLTPLLRGLALKLPSTAPTPPAPSTPSPPPPKPKTSPRPHPAQPPPNPRPPTFPPHQKTSQHPAKYACPFCYDHETN